MTKKEYAAPFMTVIALNTECICTSDIISEPVEEETERDGGE